jgi:AcrR family transcriptional regulator
VSTPVPRHSRRKQARPGELLEAALQLFLEKGYAGTRVEDVAARAGVSKGTLFLYFPSKQELFKEVVRQNISSAFADWRQELHRFQGSSAAMLCRAMEVWWQHSVGAPAGGICRLMWNEAPQFPELAAFYHQEVDEPGHAMLEHILQRGMDSGEFHAMPLAEALYLVLTPMVFIMLWPPVSALDHPVHRGLSPSVYFLSQLRNCLRGLLVQPEAMATLAMPQLPERVLPLVPISTKAS